MRVVLEVIVLLCRIIYCYVEAIFRRVVPRAPKKVSGKVALVTGAGRGIGRAVAIELAAHGVRLALWDMDANSNEETATLIKETGGSAYAYTCDVTSTQSIADAARKVRVDLGDVDILVNNAGVMSCKNILQLQEREIRRTIEVNTLSSFWTVKEFLPSMLKSNSGHVVTICSMSATGGVALLTDYCASKYGSNGFTEALSEDLRRMNKTGIQITTVYPMIVATNLVTDLSNRIKPSGRFLRLLTAERVAKDVVDGIRRNRRYVFIPRIVAGNNILSALLPVKARDYLYDFMGFGFFETSKST